MPNIGTLLMPHSPLPLNVPRLRPPLFHNDKSYLNVAALLALLNLVVAALVAWVVGADGGDGKSDDSEKFHFFSIL